MTETSWSGFHQRWARLQPPLRPTDAVAARMRRYLSANLQHALLLGITPELADIADYTVAADWSDAMIAHIWPGDTERRHAIRANWLALPFRQREFTAVLGDGSLSTLSYPEDYRTLFEQLARVLLPRAQIAIRVYAAPEEGESTADVRAAVMTGKISGFHAFKWRLGMAAAAEQSSPNIRVARIHDAFERAFPDRDVLACAARWPCEDIDEIDAYAGSEAVYSFPMRSEIVSAVPGQFHEVRFVEVGGYELAERCPILTLEYAP